MALGRTRIKTNFLPVARALAVVGRAAQEGRFKSVLQGAAETALKWLHAEYKRRSKNVWPKVGAVAVMLSGGRVPTRSIKNEQSLSLHVKRAMPLIDTGATLASLVPGRKHNVLRVSNTSLTVGSGSPILIKHQKGFSSRFRFGTGEQLRFDQNVDSVYRGRSNPFYYKQRAAIKKMHGSSYRVPPRPLPKDAPPELVDRVQRALVKALRDEIKSAVSRARGVKA